MGWSKKMEGDGVKFDLRAAPNKYRQGAVGFLFNAKCCNTQ